MNNKHHELLGVPKHANQHRLSRLTMEVHSDELRIVASAVESYTDKLIAALEVAEKRIAELQNDEVRQRLANAEHQLHMAELAKHNLRASRKAQFRKRKAAERRIAELEVREELFLRAKALMHQSGGAPIENSLNSIDAWLYDAEHAAAGKGVAS
ncbi:hypothetical protein N8S98_11875 [Enterobacter hormaechei subsp. steigerwaltii]|nr:hypothetical protein [Enterobacter hormaechei subsp. steigerwaltii]MCU3118413.1 hypothetical protein [Enterobacter hormaechei subsp. steigerwaltii]MCU3168766.1 hypothetical protein [Enterobacter hormaechei subsp. steigerwaltii]MCU3255666.1 hypothetical protein [Enterobacter hormaechei subsp. steigerwaltii]MCU3388298.1 hypothetical protein [Enterobacter hormaechei subsp. steigerwaltii]